MMIWNRRGRTSIIPLGDPWLILQGGWRFRNWKGAEVNHFWPWLAWERAGDAKETRTSWMECFSGRGRQMTLSLPLSFELTLKTRFSSARSSWLEIACSYTSGCWILEVYPSSSGLLEFYARAYLPAITYFSWILQEIKFPKTLGQL